jgi:arylsulfatase A-like enzyme
MAYVLLLIVFTLLEVALGLIQNRGIKPHIIFIVADDLGFGDASFTGMSNVRTPHIDALHANGLRMTRYYGQPVCSPSRAAIHTGRLPLAYGLQTYVIDPTGVDYGLNLNETTLPQLLRDRGGYSTHARGKWHLGEAKWEQTPTFRGYDSFLGFYSGGQDYYTHEADGGYDMHLDAGRECGANCSKVNWDAKGVYSTHLFASSAVDLIASHDASTPLFLYLAFQAVHSPDQVPQSYIDPYNATIADPKRRTFAGMLSALDEAVGNVTSAISARRDMEGTTLFVFVADNGGPIFCEDGPCGDATGTSNYPLRGGKHSLWEGGTRLTALVAGPMVHSRGVNESGLMHHADWLPTLLEAAGVAYTPAPGFELHGASQWPMLTAGAPSSRNETVTNIDPLQPAVGGGGIAPGSGNAAIITAEGWKLLLGLTGPPNAWSPPNASKLGRGGGASSGGGLLQAAAASTTLNCSAPLFHAGTCYPGFSLPGAANPTPAATAAACCAHCSSLAGCTAWTFRGKEQQCWVKNGAPAAPTMDADCVSGGGPGPAPPFAVWPLKNMTVQLFNVLQDPWEREEVSSQHPDIVQALTARLAQWGVTAKDPYFRTATKDGAPTANANGPVWVPWLD